jgi:transcriptional regulator with XRE-family HTH domain
MLDKKGSSIPFKPLGRRLKALRVALNETLAEAAGSVEIDVRQLASYELGQTRPTEDVLILLLSHFGVKDDEAVKLWSLAGYQMGRVQSAQMVSDSVTVEPVPAPDSAQIVFTDVVDVVVNNYGVVMHFMQNNGKGGPTTVAKVGMSREHAKSVLQILQVTLAQTEKPKQIASDSTPEA